MVSIVRYIVLTILIPKYNYVAIFGFQFKYLFMFTIFDTLTILKAKYLSFVILVFILTYYIYVFVMTLKVVSNLRGTGYLIIIKVRTT